MNCRFGKKLGMLAAFAGIASFASACGDIDGANEGMGEVQVVMEEAASEVLFQVVAANLAVNSAGTAARIAREDVNSLNVMVSSIGLLSRCENGDDGEECDRPWDRLVLDGFSLEVDLLNLPVEGGEVEPLAVGEIPVGTYHRVRLLISEATVTFNVDITVGNQTFLAYDENNPETVYTVEIPSGRTTGIKADVELEVTEDNQEDVGLLFDPDATFRSVIATGSGRVLMPPVFRARMRHRHQNRIQNQG